MNLQNLYNLRSVARGLLANPKMHEILGFGQWDRGTYACLWGHYERTYETRTSFWDLNEHFGITEAGVGRLFYRAAASGNADADSPGPAAVAELRRRLTLIDELIAKAEAEQSEEAVETVAA